MAGGDDDTASGATVADRPGMMKPAAGLGAPRVAEPPGDQPGDQTGDQTIDAPEPAFAAEPDPTGSRIIAPTTLTTAADAMRNEEVDRTRTFIRMGWLISIVAMAGVPVLHAPRVMNIAFIA